MQVSNSTGRNTDCRVGASGGGGTNVSYMTGNSTDVLLAPGESNLCASKWPNTVEFWVDGAPVASQTFTEDPGQVALLESDGRYWIEVTPYVADDGSVAA